MENTPPLTNREAAAAANGLNNDGFLFHMLRAYCLNTLGREFYEYHAQTAEIDVEEFERLTLSALGVPASLDAGAIRAVVASAANKETPPDSEIDLHHFQQFAVFALFTGEASKQRLRFGEIWRELFEK